MSWPAYLDTHESGALVAKVEEGLQALEACALCPRRCGINRLKDEKKLCRIGRRAQVSSVFAHHGEEDPLRGTRGSGTIFFSFCNLKCVFCQNWDTSHEGEGQEVDAEGLASMMLQLQAQRCHNINVVTPEHVVPQILEALPLAIEGGLRLPIVYNTGTYDSLHSLRLLDGVVDIYMPDFKMMSPRLSAKYLKAKDYPEVAMAAFAEMFRQVGDLELDDQGVAKRGLLVRHLVMPGMLSETEEILSWLARMSQDTYVNVMDQYRPAGLVPSHPQRYGALGRGLTRAEFETALAIAERVGLSRLDKREPRMLVRAVRRLGL